MSNTETSPALRVLRSLVESLEREGIKTITLDELRTAVEAVAAGEPEQATA